MASFIPADQRIITIEDAAELRLQQEHVVRLETRPPNAEGEGEVKARDLVKNALRMRPDRIIVGEVRSAEALDMLQAMNTGHEGSLTTIHANSPRDALVASRDDDPDGRLEPAGPRDARADRVGARPRHSGDAARRRNAPNHEHRRGDGNGRPGHGDAGDLPLQAQGHRAGRPGHRAISRRQVCGRRSWSGCALQVSRCPHGLFAEGSAAVILVLTAIFLATMAFVVGGYVLVNRRTLEAADMARSRLRDGAEAESSERGSLLKDDKISDVPFLNRLLSGRNWVDALGIQLTRAGSDLRPANFIMLDGDVRLLRDAARRAAWRRASAPIAVIGCRLARSALLAADGDRRSGCRISSSSFPTRSTCSSAR